MRDTWRKRYKEVDGAGRTVDVLLGFNANIDVVHDVTDIDLANVTPRKMETVSSLEELKAALKYHVERGNNRELELHGDVELEGGEERIGGQAGIMANLLSERGEGVIFYTPLLSNQLADHLNERILYPTIEGSFVLKNVRDCSNTDRTKRNLIFEYSNGHSGRIIFSSKMKGFGPYFRAGIEENFDQFNRNIDRIIFSGFHDAEGNKEAKMEKARKQMQQLEPDIHVEYVHRDQEISSLVREKIFPEGDSVGLDGEETRILAEERGLEIGDEPSLGECFELSKGLMGDYGLSRVHIHTHRFQITVTEKEYSVENEDTRDAMLYAQAAAVRTCETGEFPGELELDMEDKHIHDLDELEDFQHFFSLEDFVKTGTAEIGEYRVAAIPTLVHENPRRIVGLGDVISAAAFTGELK